MKYTLVLLLFLCVITSTYSQPTPSKSVLNTVLKIPDSLTKTTAGISTYVKEHFASDSDRVRAIFVWIGNNIKYDVDNMYLLDYAQDKQVKIKKALDSRSAICEGYAELFNELLTLSNIKSVVVTGYTKQRGMVDFMPHAWTAAKLYDKWYIFDPTWSSGYVDNGQFVNTFSYKFYKVPPAEILKTHMPFDPLFQFVNYPLTSGEFYEGKTTLNTSKPFFSYDDSLVTYSQLNRAQQLKNTARRVEANGVRSSIILQMLQFYKNEYENEMATIYQNAQNYGNDAVSLYNKYVEYKNKQFTPKKEDKDIQQMIDTVEINLVKAKSLIPSIQFHNPSNVKAIATLEESIGQMEKLWLEEKQFVAKYLKTSKMTRKFLFLKKV